MIFFDGSEARGLSPSASEISSDIAKKTIKPCKKMNKYYKIYAFVGLLLQKARGGSMVVGWHHPMVEINLEEVRGERKEF